MTDLYAPETAPVYVKFANGPTDEIPLDWAQRGITWLYANRRQVFADMMLHIWDAERPKRANGNKP
jgi:hypothetical protein